MDILLTGVTQLRAILLSTLLLIELKTLYQIMAALRGKKRSNVSNSDDEVDVLARSKVQDGDFIWYW